MAYILSATVSGINRSNVIKDRRGIHQSDSRTRSTVTVTVIEENDQVQASDNMHAVISTAV